MGNLRFCALSIEILDEANKYLLISERQAK